MSKSERGFEDAIEAVIGGDTPAMPFHASTALLDHTKTKLGYEIPLTRHFYKYIPPRPLAEIDAEIKQLEAEIQELLREVAE